MARPTIRPGSIVIDSDWVGWLASSLAGLEHGLRESAERAPDTGDLLVSLSGAIDSVAANALAQLDVDPDALMRSVEEARKRLDSAPERQIELVRQRKEVAIEAGLSVEADALRETERRLTMDYKLRRASALREIRERLGITDSPRQE